jgi:hypothetical protein
MSQRNKDFFAVSFHGTINRETTSHTLKCVFFYFAYTAFFFYTQIKMHLASWELNKWFETMLELWPKLLSSAYFDEL